MSDEIFRPRRPSDVQASFKKIDEIRKLAETDERQEEIQSMSNEPVGDQPSLDIKGKMPPAFAEALKRKSGTPITEPKKNFKQKKFTNDGNQNIISANSVQLKELIEGLKESTKTYEEVELPSKGRFYDGMNGPVNGILSLRPMTGEEEQILATPSFTRRGTAINMILKNCIKENYRPENFLSIDWTYLLIYLRGISYSPNYEVEIKCPECDRTFSTVIDLSTVYVEPCPDDFGPDLSDVMPNSGYKFNYRLSTSKDETDIQNYRDLRIKNFGDASVDDTLTYRLSQLLVDIEGLTNKRDLQILIKSLPVNDVAHIRNCINEPKFGVDTDIQMICPSCLHEFETILPFGINFFFPRKKKAKTQA